jgi:DNA mismatch repair protein MutS
VARMAGMPAYVIDRANLILKKLEKEHEFELEGTEQLVVNGSTKMRSGARDELQLSFFQLNDPILQQIKEDILQTDINTLTPVEALLKLNEIKKLVGGVS